MNWIKIANQKPSTYELILMYGKEKYVDTAQIDNYYAVGYLNGVNEFMALFPDDPDGDEPTPFIPTHWMYVPKIKTEEKDKDNEN